MKLATMGVHAGREDFGTLGVHASPIDLSTTYPFQDIDEAVDSFDVLASGGGDARNSIYSRLDNPTVRRFERAFAAMERASDAVAFSSGMAAITATILAATQDKKHVVAVRPIYGSTDHLLETGLLGTNVTWSGPHDIASNVREETALVFIETPANPTLDLIDIKNVVEQAGRIPVVVDSTFATPILQNPIDLGATLVVHSATKFIGGHGDVLGGIVASNDEWTAKLRQIRIATGGNMHPLAGYLCHRGLQTLDLRVRKAQETATEIATRLAVHDVVDKVYYPLFHPAYSELSLEQMHGPGTILSFTVQPDAISIESFLSSLRLVTPAVSLGSVDTLIQHPYSLTHRLVDDEAKLQSGISEHMLRLSIGVEDIDDIWTDLEMALVSAATDRETLVPRISELQKV